MPSIEDLRDVITMGFTNLVDRFNRGINNPELTYNAVAKIYCRIRNLPEDSEFDQPNDHAANIILLLLAGQEAFESNPTQLMTEMQLRDEVERLRSELLIEKTANTMLTATYNRTLQKQGIKEL